MTAPDAWFDTTRFDDARRERSVSWGAPLIALDSAPSTNDLALEAERAGAPEGATFLAREQTRGRGRRGNAWWAPPGDNLTCSVLLRPELDAGLAATLPLIVGLAVRELVADRLAAGQLAARRGALPHSPVLVKWPNDVLVGSRKIAGVLVESRLRGGILTAAIVGIGLNVRTLSFPEELAGQATSLARELRSARARPPADRSTPLRPPESPPQAPLEALLAELLGCLERRYARFRRDGFGSFLPELEVCDALRGRLVRVEDQRGVATGIRADGALRLVGQDGVERHVHAGHVELTS